MKNTSNSQNRTGNKQKAMRSYLKILRDKEASRTDALILVQNNSIGSASSKIHSKRDERFKPKNISQTNNQLEVQRAKTPLSVVNTDNFQNKRSLSKSKLSTF